MIYVVEINLICMCILLFTLRSVLTRDERNVSMSFYKWCIVCASISILSDIAFQFIENSGLSFLQNVPFLNYCVNLIYYVAAVATSYFWSMYAEYSIDGWAKNYKHAAKLLAIPVAINVVLGIMSYWNGILFKINADGCYERGSMFYINTISCYLYTFAVSIHALAKSIKATNVMKKKEYRIIATYVLFPFILGIIQIIFPEVPSVCLGMSLPILYVHTQLQIFLKTAKQADRQGLPALLFAIHILIILLLYRKRICILCSCRSYRLPLYKQLYRLHHIHSH